MVRKSKIVGITGGIGTGKSVVAKILQTMGFFVFNSDDVAKKRIANDERIQQQIIDLLGPLAFVNGTYNRTWVAEQVFEDSGKLSALNNIIHPAVARAFKELVDSGQHAILFKESAILFERNLVSNLHSIWVIDAPQDLRIQRIQARSGISESEIRTRMEQQWPQTEKMKRADYVIYNDGKRPLIPQIEAGLTQEQKGWTL